MTAWRISDYRHNNGDWIIVDGDGQGVATAIYQGAAKRGQSSAADPDGLAVANRIVQCVNSHDALVAACSKALGVLAGEDMNKQGLIDALTLCRAALAAARSDRT